mgnify:CR=1 FL=1
MEFSENCCITLMPKALWWDPSLRGGNGRPNFSLHPLHITLEHGFPRSHAVLPHCLSTYYRTDGKICKYLKFGYFQWNSVTSFLLAVETILHTEQSYRCFPWLFKITLSDYRPMCIYMEVPQGALYLHYPLQAGFSGYTAFHKVHKWLILISCTSAGEPRQGSQWAFRLARIAWNRLCLHVAHWGKMCRVSGLSATMKSCSVLNWVFPQSCLSREKKVDKL